MNEKRMDELARKEAVEISYDRKKTIAFYEKLRGRIITQLRLYTKNRYNTLIEYLMFLPDLFILLTRLMMDKRVSNSQHLLISAMIAYVIMPIDLIPDMIPVIGYLDDLVFVVYGLNMILNDIDKQIVLENWSGEEELIYLLGAITDKANRMMNKKVLFMIRRILRRRKI